MQNTCLYSAFLARLESVNGRDTRLFASPPPGGGCKKKFFSKRLRIYIGPLINKFL